MTASVLLPYRRPAFAGNLDPAAVITVTIGGRTFRAGRRTAAHLAATVAALAKAYPAARLVVIQPCYNTSVEASAGTHDGDGVLDVRIEGITWLAAQRFLRRLGWAAWWRHTGEWSAPSAWHIHMVSLGCPGPVGIYVPGQVIDYYHHAEGLKGQHDSGDDPTWHPASIDGTYFDFVEWEREIEDNMAWTDWTPAERKAAADDIAAAVAPIVVRQLLAAFVDKDGTETVKAALRNATDTEQLVRQLADGLHVDLPKDG